MSIKKTKKKQECHIEDWELIKSIKQQTEELRKVVETEEKYVVIDSVMGKGKTNWCIRNMIMNFLYDKTKFIFVTPYLSEVNRIKKVCHQCGVDVKTPIGIKNKAVEFEDLLAQNDNIVITQELFKRIGATTLCKILELKNVYDLYIDESPEVIESIHISSQDVTHLEKYTVIDNNGRVNWISENGYSDTFGKFFKEREKGCIGELYKVSKTKFLAFRPDCLFRAMNKVYFLTYLFEGQLLYSYMKFYSMNFVKKQVVINKSSYNLVDYTIEEARSELEGVSSKLKVIQHAKINDGNERTNYSSNYFEKLTKENLKQKKRNIQNYFIHIAKTTSHLAMWTVLKDYKEKLEASPYIQGFVPLNARASNDFRHKRHLAYMCNRFMNPFLSKGLKHFDISLNEKLYAVSELVQWVFRSAIRDDVPITLYLPSKRMRDLLNVWLSGKLFVEAKCKPVDKQ